MNTVLSFVIALATVWWGVLPWRLPEVQSTPELFCEQEGGAWVAGTSSLSGACWYSILHAESRANCTETQVWKIAYLAGTAEVGDCVDIDPAAVPGNPSTCWLLDGAFENEDTGPTCTLQHGVYGACNGASEYHYDSQGAFTHVVCSSASSGSASIGTNWNPGRFRLKITDEAGGIDTLWEGKNTLFRYAAGTCAVACVVTPALPTGPAQDLPGAAVATLYVRIVENDTDWYLVCFETGDKDKGNPGIYRYVSGKWAEQPVLRRNAWICVAAQGDGSFALIDR